MSFLKSVIADARPRKPMLEPLDGLSAIPGWNTRGPEGNPLVAEGESPGAPDQTSRLSRPLSIREGASDINMGDAQVFQVDNPVNQGIQDMVSNVESESPLSATVDKSGPIPDEESFIRLGPVDLPNRESGSEGDKASKAEGSMTLQPVGTIIPDSRMDSSEEEVAGVIATDDQRYSDGTIKGAETLTIQAEATGGKARQVSPGVDKQAAMKSLSNQEETPQLQKLDAAKGVLRDVQLISLQAMMDSHISSDMELASVPQSTGKKESTSAVSPGPAPSKTGIPEQHITRPARPSASPETLRSVLATPFQTDSMPKAGDTIRSRPPLRSPEKTDEAPKVQIGQIDVIIEAAAQPATKPAPAPSSDDLASRHYLRRL